MISLNSIASVGTTVQMSWVLEKTYSSLLCGGMLIIADYCSFYCVCLCEQGKNHSKKLRNFYAGSQQPPAIRITDMPENNGQTSNSSGGTECDTSRPVRTRRLNICGVIEQMFMLNFLKWYFPQFVDRECIKCGHSWSLKK